LLFTLRRKANFENNRKVVWKMIIDVMSDKAYNNVGI
jgi:hypothetical protein